MHISFDSCVNSNALFYYNEKHKNDPPLILTENEKLEERVLMVKIKMSNNAEWSAYLKKKAAENKITLDSCMTADAEWTVKNDMFKENVERYKKIIRETPKWLSDVTAKAGEWKISLDSAINIDARYMAGEDLKKKKK